MPDASLNSVATLIVKPGAGELAAAQAAARQALAAAGASLGPADRLSDIACDLPFDRLPVEPARKILAEALADRSADYAVQPARGRRKRMLIADMDSTMIAVECIDELADFAGLKPKVAAITEAAMRGELDFAQALAERVALLAGLDVAVLERCYAERVTPNPGAETLVATMAAHGALTVLVSGGFTFFTERVAARLGFAVQRANVLAVEAGRLTGRVVPPLVTAQTKRQTLIELCGRHGIDRGEVLAVGDGANDIPMIETAGLGVAYRAKPKLETAADVAIRHADLTALLYLQGYRQTDFRG